MKSQTELQFDAEVRHAADVLREGGLILYPTDTVWGIGADARNAEAVSRIFELKRRADSKSMLALLDSVESLKVWVDHVPPQAMTLIEEATGPLTIIYDSPKGVADNLTAPDGSLGIRITSERFSAELCRALGAPVVSTSANISGQPTPHFFNEICEEIRKGVDYAVSYRRDDLTPCPPSRIVKVSDMGNVTVIR